MSVTIWHMDTQARLDIDVIGRRLFAQRQKLSLEQEQVAERAQMSRAYISRLERGAIPNPKLLDLARVADVLAVPLATLVSPDAHPRTIVLAEGADLLNQLADEPPELAESILRILREGMEIARSARVARTN